MTGLGKGMRPAVMRPAVMPDFGYHDMRERGHTRGKGLKLSGEGMRLSGNGMCCKGCGAMMNDQFIFADQAL